MLGKTKLPLSLATFVLILMVVANANADPLQIVTQSGGFQFSGVGSNGNGTGITDFDVLIGDPGSASHTIDSAGGSFTTVINPLTFIQGFTGFGSEGTYQINFSQLLTVSVQNGDYHDFLLVRFDVMSNCNPEPVPEPTSLLLLGTGLTGVVVKGRKRRKGKV